MLSHDYAHVSLIDFWCPSRHAGSSSIPLPAIESSDFDVSYYIRYLRGFFGVRKYREQIKAGQIKKPTILINFLRPICECEHYDFFSLQLLNELFQTFESAWEFKSLKQKKIP